MQTYNKIMLYFWLAMTVVSAMAITFMSITDGFNRWGMYYVLPIITLGVFFIRRYMMKHMEKHQEYLKQQIKEKKERDR